jgi:hypothetical protein
VFGHELARRSKGKIHSLIDAMTSDENEEEVAPAEVTAEIKKVVKVSRE